MSIEYPRQEGISSDATGDIILNPTGDEVRFSGAKIENVLQEIDFRPPYAGMTEDALGDGRLSIETYGSLPNTDTQLIFRGNDPVLQARTIIIPYEIPDEFSEWIGASDPVVIDYITSDGSALNCGVTLGIWKKGDATVAYQATIATSITENQLTVSKTLIELIKTWDDDDVVLIVITLSAKTSHWAAIRAIHITHA